MGGGPGDREKLLHSTTAGPGGTLCKFEKDTPSQRHLAAIFCKIGITKVHICNDYSVNGA